jgi:hypothetical protein
MLSKNHLMLQELVQGIFGLTLGLAIALFHRPIADFMLERERALDFLFRSRGINLPPPPTKNATREIYFVVGIVLALFETARLWLAIH